MVSFQNARAKWRRTRAQEPQGPQNPNHPGASATGCIVHAQILTTGYHWPRTVRRG